MARHRAEPTILTHNREAIEEELSRYPVSLGYWCKQPHALSRYGVTRARLHWHPAPRAVTDAFMRLR